MQITQKHKGVVVAILFVAIMILPVVYTMVRSYKDNHTRKKRVAPPRAEFNYKITVHDSLNDGYILLSPYQLGNWGYGQLVVMDLKGNIVFDKKTNGAIYDFRQWKINGATRYTYFVNDTAAMHIRGIGVAAGHVVVLDSAMNEIRQVHLLPHNEVVLNNRQDLDPHDFLLVSDDHYYTLASYQRTVNNIPAALNPSPKVKLAIPVIQEVNNGMVVWQWDAANYPEFYANSVESDKYADTVQTQDYMHINSIFIDPADSNLIVSFRNQDQVIKINKHTGDIVWRLGGKNSDFHLDAEQVFLRQHNAKLVDDNQVLLIYDNGDSTARPHSRILEFRLDEKNKKIAGFRAFDIPAPYAQYMGSVDKYGDDYFIGGGSGNYVLEINRTTGRKKFELVNNLAIYRAYLVKDIKGIR